MRIWQGWVIFFSLLLAACSTKIPTNNDLQTNHHIPTEFTNQTSKTAIKADLSNSKQLDSALGQIGLLINDKSLYNLLEIALEKNTNVLTMVSRIAQAKSQMKINTASLFPTINAGLNTNYTDRRTQAQSLTVRPGTNSVNASLSVSWEIDLFGKLNALRQSSKKDYAQAQSNLANAQISLVAEVSTLYFTLRDNAYNLRFAKDTLKNLEEIDILNMEKYHQGLIDINTYKTIKANVISQKNTIETLSYTFEQNKNALLVLLDINNTDLKVNFLDTNYVLPKINNFDVSNVPSEVILKRPDVQASIYALHSQLYKTTNAKAAQFPTISLSGSIGQLLYSNISGNSLVFQIANAITAPILNRTSLRQTYLKQKELTKEATYTLQNTINTALGEIENALFDLDSKKRQIQNNEVIFELGEEAYQTDVERVKNGMLDRGDFLANENSYYALQTQLFTSKINELLATITLFKVFGGDLYFPSNTTQ